jgi:hypothetical protein
LVKVGLILPHHPAQTLSEFIEDTEDLVNISLDAQRNRIISCDVCFSGINSMNGVSGCGHRWCEQV